MPGFQDVISEIQIPEGILSIFIVSQVLDIKNISNTIMIEDIERQKRKQKRRDLFETAPISRNIFAETNQSELIPQEEKIKKQLSASNNTVPISSQQSAEQLAKLEQEAEKYVELEGQAMGKIICKQEKQKQNKENREGQNGFIFQGSGSSEDEQEEQNTGDEHKLDNEDKIIFEGDNDDYDEVLSIAPEADYQKNKPSKKTIELFGQKVEVDAQLVEQSEQSNTSNNSTIQTQAPKKQLLMATTMMPENTFAKLQMIRNKSTGILSLCLESNRRFILACKHMSGKTYHISESIHNFEENGPAYVGKIKASFFGNEVSFYSKGFNPQKAKQAKVSPRQLLCTVVSHSQQILEEVKPRDFSVFILKPNVDYYKDLLGTTEYEQEVPLNKLYSDYQTNKSKIALYDNRKSKWNEKEKMYSLNMKGRAKLPSIKNFILESLGENGREIMLLGKYEENAFSFDIHHPLSPAIAMTIALTSFIHKSW